MKTLIDGRVLRHIHITGVERYCLSLVEEFNKTGFEFDVAEPGSTNRYLQHIWENTALPNKAANYDVLFCPGNMSPLWKPKGCKYVTTIHDISFRFYKDTYGFLYRLYHDITIARVLGIADAIIAVSNYEKEMMSAYYPESAAKIRVVYNGISENLKNRPVIYEKDKYILYVGSLNKRKNLSGLIDAFLKIADKIPHSLVIAGAEQKVFSGTQRKSHDRIKYLGFVADNELVELYKKASVFVFPSFYEGFGFPPLEAMALGCPVITSNVSCLPEIVGNAAIRIDPMNTGEIADTMLRVVNSDELRRTLIEKGLEKVKSYSWAKSAKELVQIFREVSAG